jgi:hypothetical protein
VLIGGLGVFEFGYNEEVNACARSTWAKIVGHWGRNMARIRVGEKGMRQYIIYIKSSISIKEDICLKYQRRNRTQNPALLFTTRLTTCNHKLRHFIRSIQRLLLIRNLARGTTIARRNIKRWISHEEIPRSKEQCHWFCRHDGEVFGGREMGDAKGVPEDDIGVVD